MKLRKNVSARASSALGRIVLILFMSRPAFAADRDLVADTNVCPSLQGEARRLILGGQTDPCLRSYHKKDADRSQQCIENPPGGAVEGCMGSSRGRMKPATHQGARRTCHIHAVAGLLEYGTEHLPNYRISRQCMAKFSAEKDSGSAWRLLKNLIHEPRKYPIEIHNQSPVKLIGGLFSESDCPYDGHNRDTIPDRALRAYPKVIPPAHLRVSLPRHNQNEDPIDFVRTHLRSGHILLASIFVTNSPWWHVFNSKSLETGEVRAVSDDTDGRSQRLRIIYQTSQGMPTLAESPSFRRFVEAVSDPLPPPSTSILARDLEDFAAEAERSGEQEATFFAGHVHQNGNTAGMRHFGTHAILITGWNDIDKVVEFRNSWGPRWKDNGYGYMTYDYFRRFLQSYWYDELPLMAYKPNLEGHYHTSGHPEDTHPLF